MIKRTHSVCLLIKVEKKVQAICLRNVSSNVEHNNVSKIIWDRSLLRPQQKWGYNVHRSLVLSIYNFASTQEDTLHSIHLLEWNKHTYSLFNFAIFAFLGRKPLLGKLHVTMPIYIFGLFICCRHLLTSAMQFHEEWVSCHCLWASSWLESSAQPSKPTPEELQWFSYWHIWLC